MENDKKKAPKFSLTWVYIIIAVVLGYLMINSEGSGTMLGGTSRIVTYGEFKTYVEKGYARNIVASKDKGSLQMFVEAEHIRDVFKQTTVEKGKLPFVETQYPSDDRLDAFLDEQRTAGNFNGEITYRKDSNLFGNFLWSFGPLFFLVAIGVGVVIHYAMKWLDARNPHTQRITIVSIAFCFAMAYIAEQYFGIADITGAYIAGIVLCTMTDAPYVERRVDISNYVIFAPIFFASIGLKTDISGLTPEILLFCICFVIVALLTKIIGCGLAAKICRFNWGDSLKVGVGMMTRGEVALIVAQKGLEIGVVDPVYFTAVILLIIVSSVATPLVLKTLFAKMPPVQHPSQLNG